MDAVKLYDKDGNFVKRHIFPPGSDYFYAVRALNQSGLFVKKQFNKAMKLVRSYVGQDKEHVV